MEAILHPKSVFWGGDVVEHACLPCTRPKLQSPAQAKNKSDNSKPDLQNTQLVSLSTEKME